MQYLPTSKGQGLVEYALILVLVAVVVIVVLALLGIWLARLMALPEIFTLSIGGTAFPIIWAILGSALFDPVRNDPRFARAVTEVRAEAQDRVARGRAGLSGPL